VEIAVRYSKAIKTPSKLKDIPKWLGEWEKAVPKEKKESRWDHYGEAP
jgi:hypothetical protein